MKTAVGQDNAPRKPSVTPFAESHPRCKGHCTINARRSSPTCPGIPRIEGTYLHSWDSGPVSDVRVVLIGFV